MKHILKYSSTLSYSTLLQSSISASIISIPKRYDSQQMTSLENKKILVTGGKGQVGKAIIKTLCKEAGEQNIVATDCNDIQVELPCKYLDLDVTDFETFKKIVKTEKIEYIIHMAAILSALAEKIPERAMEVNINGYMNALHIAKEFNCKIFVPSSIAIYGGPHFNKDNTPLHSILQPSTIYGVSKMLTEQLGTYFYHKFGVDFRSARYPVIVSSEKYEFNGTAAFSTEVFFEALQKKYYKCCLGPNTALPMMYIDDCVNETINLIKADNSRLRSRYYNMAGISVTPQQLTDSIKKMIDGFQIEYEPDFRQQIADTWPKKINDIESQEDWGLSYNLTVDQFAQRIMDGIDPIHKQGVEIKRIV